MEEKIRVLQVITVNIGSGVASMLMNIYRNLDKEKVQFDFVTWNVNKDNNFVNEIEHAGGKVYTIPHYKVSLFGFLKGLKEVIDHNRYKIIHCHESLASIPALYYAKKNGVKCRIAHSHNPSMEGKLKNYLVKYSRKLFQKNCTDFFACSLESGKFLFGKEAEIMVINNAIYSARFIYNNEVRLKLRKELNIESDYVLGNIGRLCEQKNQTFLIDILNEIVKKNKNVKLLLIGTGELEEDLRSKIKEYNIENHVIFLGLRKDVPDLLQAIDCLVFPSIFEGLPVVIVEAQAAELKCFISDTITREVRVSELVTYLSLEKNAAVWANEIMGAPLMERTGNNSFILEAGYDLSTTVRDLQELYLSKV